MKEICYLFYKEVKDSASVSNHNTPAITQIDGMKTLVFRAMMQAVDEPLAIVAKWALAKTRAGSIPSFGSSCIAFTELDISEREYNPALMLTFAQPPIPSATPITCSSTHIKLRIFTAGCFLIRCCLVWLDQF
ncbi:hypothetical protein HanPI659440_Chr16g0622041 [Helianthus annuus]|nr:hypothetical protein HanPI659440_Chr16g0622041 [Helianthus annuus]